METISHYQLADGVLYRNVNGRPFLDSIAIAAHGYDGHFATELNVAKIMAE